MSYRQEIELYTDEHGLVHPWHDRDSLNGLTYLAYSLTTLLRLNDLTENDKIQFLRTFWRCEIASGLICRKPGRVEQQSVDDMQSVACSCMITGNHFLAKKVVDYMSTSYLRIGPFKFKYFYNTERPGTQLNREGKKNWSAWLGRFPVLILELKWAAGEKRTLLQRLLFTLDCLYTAAFTKKNTQDEYMQLWIRTEAFAKHWLVIMTEIILELRGIKLKDKFTEYFGADYPITKYCND